MLPIVFWYMSADEIGFATCGEPYRNKGNGMHVFTIDAALVERQLRSGTAHRSWMTTANRLLQPQDPATKLISHRTCQECAEILGR
jgi:hypothetical protein